MCCKQIFPLNIPTLNERSYLTLLLLRHLRFLRLHVLLKACPNCHLQLPVFAIRVIGRVFGLVLRLVRVGFRSQWRPMAKQSCLLKLARPVGHREHQLLGPLIIVVYPDDAIVAVLRPDELQGRQLLFVQDAEADLQAVFLLRPPPQDAAELINREILQFDAQFGRVVGLGRCFELLQLRICHGHQVLQGWRGKSLLLNLEARNDSP
ncbi:hypothetical protein GE09DRAFT_555970 [Coniochaeta sp. 2T2.1]|nr:hypothetical protein GE09DRAFT_555970 [Coniochaeta sp. 2T2.1]